MSASRTDKLPDGLVARYRHMAEHGEIKSDPAQLLAAEKLQVLANRLSDYGRPFRRIPIPFFERRSSEPPMGLYIYGAVGRGKTMLMDLFFESLPVPDKRRAHFLGFMADVHERIHAFRQKVKRGEMKDTDPIPSVAAALADQASVLCFDEFTVTDIADAMILSRLFSALFANGVVLVATSNVAPGDLYRDGLNRALFTPFIAILKQHTDVFALDQGQDYRLEQLKGMPVYITPADAAADHLMDRAWEAMTRGAKGAREEISVKGRQIAVPRAAGRSARFSFADLCEAALGARDYLAIVAKYDTIFIDHVPVLADGRRNEAKRLILLVDTLYDHGTRLVVSAEAAPTALYQGKSGTEVFEFERTASRLIEMQGKDWLDAWSARHEQSPAAAAI